MKRIEWAWALAGAVLLAVAATVLAWDSATWGSIGSTTIEPREHSVADSYATPPSAQPVDETVLDDLADLAGQVAGIELETSNASPLNEDAPSAEADREWAAFPRFRKLAHLLIRRHGRARLGSDPAEDSKKLSAKLFRHVQLNPTDTWIAPTQRALLVSLIQRHLDLSIELGRMRLRLINDTGMALYNSGKLDPVLIPDPATQQATVAAAAKALATNNKKVISELYRLTKDGKKAAYLITEDQIPSVDKVRDMEKFMTAQLASNITSYFRYLGLLSPVQAQALIRQSVPS